MGPPYHRLQNSFFSPMEPVFTPSKLMKWFINSSLWSVTCVYLETCVPSAQWWYKPRYMILLFLCYTHATHATYALIVVVVKLLFKTYKRGKNSFLLIFSRSAVKIIEIFRTSCSFFKIAHLGRGRRSWPNCHGRTLSYYTHNDNSHRVANPNVCSPIYLLWIIFYKNKCVFCLPQSLYRVKYEFQIYAIIVH